MGDFDGDGKSDPCLVVQNSDDISVFLGDGSGGFGPATNFAVGTPMHSLAAADFNGDGKLDLAATTTSTDVSVLLGDGSGGFGTATNFAAGVLDGSVNVGDFTGDGKLDLAVTTTFWRISLLPGDGNGGVAAPPPLWRLCCPISRHSR